MYTTESNDAVASVAVHGPSFLTSHAGKMSSSLRVVMFINIKTNVLVRGGGQT